MRCLRLSYVLCSALAVTPPALAGVADTPLPLLAGKKAMHVFTVPGVTHTGGLGTVFMCASTEKANPVTIGIEVFDYNGILLNELTPASDSGPLAPGRTYTFATFFNGGYVAAFSTNNLVALESDANHATARILATSPSIVCAALIVEVTGVPPTSMASLPVIAKLKQDGN